MGVSTYSETDEYGQPRDAAEAYDYGWLGTRQRSADALGGIVLMGVRLYDSAIGRFLSADPIANGNANAYIYPDDPLTMSTSVEHSTGGGRCITFTRSEAKHWGHQLVNGATINDLIFWAFGWLPGGVSTLVAAAGTAIDQFIRDLGNAILRDNGTRGVQVKIGFGLKHYYKIIPVPWYEMHTLGRKIGSG